MAMGTVVIRTRRYRPGWAVSGIAASLVAVLLVSAFAVLDQSPALVAALDEVLEEPQDPPSAQPPVAEPPPATGPLPPEDLQGRIAPSMAGFRPIKDAESGLGPLTVEQLVALSESEQDAPDAIAGLRDLGVEEAFGRAFGNADVAYTVIVYRCDTPENAQRLLAATTVGTDRIDLGVPDAVTYAPEDEGAVVRGLVARGRFVYEVAAHSADGPVDTAVLQRALLHQRSHAVLVS
jgi:hypothetical protein